MGVGYEGLGDEDLVARARAADTAAFAELYRRHRERVYRLAYRFVGNKADALDLCQETFVKALESLGSFRGSSSFSTWLTRIATNTCVDFCRHSRVRQSVPLDEHYMGSSATREPRPGQSLEREEVRQAVEEALAKLTPDHRAVFVLHTIEGLTYQEIAEAVGCPVGTVMSRLHYARKRLRGLLARFVKE